MSIYRFGPEFHLSRVARILWSPIPSILFLYIIYMESPEFLRKDPNSLQYWTLSRRMSWHVIPDLSQQRQEGRQVQWARWARPNCWRGEEGGGEEGGHVCAARKLQVWQGPHGLVPDSFSSLGSLFTFIFCICVWLTHLPTRWDDIYAH